MNKVVVSLFALAGALAQPAFAQDAETLLNSKACLACHKTDTQLVGPSYQAIAEKYADDENAVEMLAGKIRNGSQGVWGQIPMPPNQVTEDEARVLAEWVMEQN
ncbi:c-type cytochrome [Stutzerimonas tarimensis]|uniref:Cytochrome c-551 n=1 Tax=Stutzerimonas tarimensis TaxID=1507735 RepID=A0ABV7T5N7_9GAMM